MAQKQIGYKSKATVAHVGAARFEGLTQIAIDLSGVARRQITPSQFLKYMIDNYADKAKEELKIQLVKENETKGD